MKIRTDEEVIDKISQELAWRRSEILTLEGVVMRERKNIHALRATAPMLYAHWEGFVKNSCTYYLCFISCLSLSRGQLSNNLLGLVIREKIEIFSSKSTKAELFEELAKNFVDFIDEKAKLPYKDIIDTGSNLKPVVLRNIIFLLGLKYDFFESKEKTVINPILEKRNGIAHGQWVEFDWEDFLFFRSEIINLMSHLKDLLENAVVQKSYIRV
ncbi:MAE_28990/MAE_18760 family HEPN-like nuclease [Chromobacterium paludis]|uniref:MAE-28990/MAE-18760-like HEPN domain-containing protein n=1 Tax=Chromobacterium paludis TaxID=2605945 RepID=A0A5C1DMV9_9NEIS|nr:MAE_28990/MAE_18760 family HEPN-like nuclease [Chromobacterium paludis]QEL57208.1 hypothetical protein FYK34_17395 [Chromobacterium paludis]